jgi:DNA-binding CsgD family transcriptional regulator
MQRSLTPRQRHVLIEAAQDASAAETGAHLGIAPSAVIVHRRDARRRLGVRTTAGAIGRMVVLGIIKPEDIAKTYSEALAQEAT